MTRDQLLLAITTAGYVNPANILSEEQVLSRLLSDCAEFKRFYLNERKKIKKEIFWFLNPMLTSSLRNEPILGKKDIVLGYTINTKLPEIDPVNVFDAAYEFIDIIRSEEGFREMISLTSAASGPQSAIIQNTASALSSMLNGPSANAMLAASGFNLWPYYDTTSNIQRQQLEPYTIEPQLPLWKLYQVSFYVQKALDWELACEVSPRENNEFLSWYEDRYPTIALEGREVLEWIKLTGYNTPGKARRIFRKMIQQYEAGAYLTVS